MSSCSDKVICREWEGYTSSQSSLSEVNEVFVGYARCLNISMKNRAVVN